MAVERGPIHREAPTPNEALNLASQGVAGQPEEMRLETEEQTINRQLARLTQAVYEAEAALGEIRRFVRVQQLRKKGREAFDEAERLVELGGNGRSF